jgi:hypothetical protein
MRPGNRGRKIEDTQARKAACQIPLIVTGYSHLSQNSFGLSAFVFTVRRDPKWRRHGRKGSRVGNRLQGAGNIAAQIGPFLALALFKAG